MQIIPSNQYLKSSALVNFILYGQGKEIMVIVYLQGSQRQLTHVGRQQVALLNKWTKSFAQRVATAAAINPDTQPAVQNYASLLASAEAPFADPFLMEFEDQNAVQQAYSEAPMTFEQALMAARLEAKKASEVRPLATNCIAM